MNGVLEIVLSSVPPFPPEATHVFFVPILYVLLSVSLLLGGFTVALWRFFVWLRERISEGVQMGVSGFSAALAAHEKGERSWQDRIEQRQLELRDGQRELRDDQRALRVEFQEARAFLSDRVEAVHVRIDHMVEAGGK